MAIEILRLLYQILLIFAITYLSIGHPELISITMALCTWYLASVIRESREGGEKK